MEVIFKRNYQIVLAHVDSDSRVGQWRAEHACAENLPLHARFLRKLDKVRLTLSL